tara:strand:- start:7242 stop:9077 length:1836 start_codon:yes stop_codon:yes gene_type:complete
MGYETHPSSGLGGQYRDNADHRRLRQAREQHSGFPVGQFLQTPPMLFTRDGHNVFLGDMYRGQSAFLVCGGPSLDSHDLTLLNSRGVLTFGVNNAATVVRPNLWCCVDDPTHFADAIWYDPGITKFVPLCHMEKKFVVRDEVGDLVESRELVGDMPAVFGYRRNESFVAEQWMHEDTFNWGNHGKLVDAYGNKGSRSVMYVAIRMLYFLGVRRIYLIGCDFRMKSGGKNYAFDQDRTDSSVKGNNSIYRILNERFKKLNPHFDDAGLQIWNCTPDSGLTAFPYMDYEAAIAKATSLIPSKIETSGLYDRQARERAKEKERRSEEKKRQEKSPPMTPLVTKIAPNEKELQEQQTRLEARQAILADLTLLVAVDEKHLQELQLTWKTWATFKPDIRECPLVLIHDASLDANSIQLEPSPSKLTLVSWEMPEAENQREKMLTSLVRVAAERVETSWYLKLDTDVVAVNNSEWLEPEWFTADEDGRLPAFVSSPWGYTKPAEAIDRLDDWGDTIAELKKHSRLELAQGDKPDRVNHARIISWCFFGNTAWTKQVTSWVNGRLPVPSHDTFLFYCAERRKDHYRRYRMAKCGWEHISHFRRLKAKCDEVMQPLKQS